MKAYLNINTFDAALARIRWLFDSFDQVVVSFSGGKDSTVCLELALRVAEEKGKLPLPVLFLDQEAEWGSVIDYVRSVMYDPRVEPLWLQVPVRLFNATSIDEPWLKCWDPEAKERWIHPQDPISIKENIYGTDRFAALFDAFLLHRYPTQSVCCIGGVRAEESPARLQGLTAYETFKGETWGRKLSTDPVHVNMYPIYDWSYTDVWKAIHENGWNYCSLYDRMYQYGVPVLQMRVSNVHHETAVAVLFFLQEIEADLWNRVVARISGINTAKHLRQDMITPQDLPFMFKDWWEYRDHLVEKLIGNEEHKAIFRKTFASFDARYDQSVQLKLVKAQIGAVLVNDYHGTKLSSFAAQHGSYSKSAGKRGGIAKAIRDRRGE